MAKAEGELQRDLVATVEARRELGSDYDAELVASFCDRIDETIQRRIDEQSALRRPSGWTGPDAHPFVLGLTSLGTGIPITGIAGGIADLPGIAVAWLGIVGVNVAYAWSRRH